MTPDRPQMAFQAVEKRAALGTLELELEVRRDRWGRRGGRGRDSARAPGAPTSGPRRLAALEAQVAQLRATREQQLRQVEARRAHNEQLRAAYDELRAHAGLREAALRRREEEARELLERLVQSKARAAAERNLRNERRERLVARSGRPPGGRSTPLPRPRPILFSP